MKNLTTTTLEICADCLFLIANGEGPDDVAKGWFSWQDCDGCGSTLGGNRYYATGWSE